jgi:signal peptidase I
VKRVIGLPYEHLVIKDSKVYIDDKHLEEDYLIDAYTDGDIDIIIPSDHIFVMGDNRENSDDSRKSYIGTISLDDILGKVFVRMYPFNKGGQIE